MFWWPSLCACLSGKCFLYCNGLMDHIYVCQNGASCSSWYKTPTHFSGTLVRALPPTPMSTLHELKSPVPACFGSPKRFIFRLNWLFTLAKDWPTGCVYFPLRMLSWRLHVMREPGPCGADCPPHCESHSDRKSVDDHETSFTNSINLLHKENMYWRWHLLR